MRRERAWGRWFIFNAVGLMGMTVQLTVLSMLLPLGLPLLVATGIAVECAVLHNFAWHERWTWPDRPATSVQARLGRLASFHALNGAISVVGNVALVAVLTSRASLPPVCATLLAIAACSTLTYLASHRLVFGSGRRGAALAVFVFLSLSTVHADDGWEGRVRPETLAGWRAYEQAVDERYAHPADTFFALDTGGAREDWRQRAQAGATPMLQFQAARPGGPRIDVPGGLIHHWAGAIFVPGRTVDGVLRFVEDHAGREAGAYEDVTASKLLERHGDELRVFMRLRRTRIITVTYDTEHQIAYRRLATARASGRSVATRITEIADAGTPAEHETRDGDDAGYLWRLNVYWRYEQSGDGVLIECESVSLSRAVPLLLRPVIGGMVEGVARESLEKTLRGLKRALLSG